jgi:hypothetical protein
VRRIAHQYQTMRDGRRQTKVRQRKADRRADGRQCAQHVGTGVAARAVNAPGSSASNSDASVSGADHTIEIRRLQRRCQHAAVGAEPLVGTAVMGAFAAEIGDHGGLP